MLNPSQLPAIRVMPETMAALPTDPPVAMIARSAEAQIAEPEATGVGNWDKFTRMLAPTGVVVHASRTSRSSMANGTYTRASSARIAVERVLAAKNVKSLSRMLGLTDSR